MLATVEQFVASPYYQSSYSESAILEALRYAERRFYELTNREKYGYWLEPRRVTMSLDGTGGRLLRTKYPVLKLLSCEIITSITGEYLDITNSVRLRNHFLWYRDGFPEGFANVRVVALCGDPHYGEGADVPEDVREAVLRLADLKLRRKRIAGEEVSERRPSANPPPPPPTLTGDREVDGIIRTYTITRPLDMVDIRGPLSPDELEKEF